MAILVNPNNVKVISQNGEVTLALQIELNINLNANGIVSQSNGYVPDNTTSNKNIKKNDDEEASWLVPDFNSKEKIKFGK